jgi:tetratricopeptide (TPR) repeat protein
MWAMSPFLASPGLRYRAGLLTLALTAVVRHAWALDVSFINDDFLFLERARRSTFLANWNFDDALGNVYRPLTRNLYFWVGLRLFGRDPTLYHVVNLGLFALGGVLLALVVERLTAVAFRLDGAARGRAAAAGLAAGLFFVLHPAAGTPASWICGVQDLAAVDLVLATILAHLAGRRVLAFLAYAAAVLSKETAALLFPLVAAWDWLVARTSLSKALLRQAPAAAFFAVWLAVNRWLPWNDLGRTIHAPAGGGPSVLGRFDPETVLITLRALLLVEPWERLEWPHGVLATLAQVVLAGIVLAVAGTLAAGAKPAAKKAAAPAAASPALAGFLLFAIGWLLSGVLPLIAIVSHFVYYAYYPALALSLLLGTVCFVVVKRRAASVAVAAAVALVLLAGAGIAYHPALCDAHNIRRASGYLWRFHRDLTRLHPTFPARSRLYFWNLPPWIGFQLADGPALRVWYGDSTLTGRYLSTYAPEPGRPSYFFGHDDAGNLVEIVRGLPDPGLAAPLPIYALSHTDLGATLAKVGEHDAAIVEWRKVLQVDANFSAALYNLGATLARSERYAEALPILERAAAIEPLAADIQLELGRAATGVGRLAQAEAAFEAFMQLAPESAQRAQVEDVLRRIRAAAARGK